MSLIDTAAPISVPNTATAILDRARAVAPLLRERSVDIEQGRRLPDDVVDLLRGTGVFRMASPRARGGPELNSVEQTEVIEALAYGDASAGWCAMIGMDTPLYAGFLAEPVADALFTDPDLITAGLILPIGRAERVPGGYRVSGRWQFGSGITHADWVVAGCVVHVDGKPEPSPHGAPIHWRIMIAPQREFEILDTWHTTGLAGSGSRDYQVQDLFVPEERSFSLREPHRDGANFAVDTILRNMPGVPLGVARAALDWVRKLAAGRVHRPTGQPWAENYRVQTTIAEAEMELGAARDSVYGSLRRQWAAVEEGRQLTVDQQMETVLARTNSFRVARRVVSALFDLCATTSIYKPSPLDRWLRDVNTMCQHVIAQEQVIQSVGARLLGGTPHNPFSVGIIP
ncbi:acyl-CoA dehydrogenase [Actinoplanes regularis]|uniref:acyl-CoA dehydrogenase n=1 Tax=Actinoplanes regularis TaxID=52697 RepID=UPI0024A56842|nr:acyl-CoA dehydrogenase [Actinoplanes regularis]GLW30928.1 hydroxylase [Actinoplanes regularis]